MDNNAQGRATVAARLKHDSEFEALVRDLFNAGLRSTTLLAEALQTSDEACRQALIRLGLHQPRQSLRDVLGSLDASLRDRAVAYAHRRKPPPPITILELPTECPAKVLKFA